MFVLSSVRSNQQVNVYVLYIHTFISNIRTTRPLTVCIKYKCSLSEPACVQLIMALNKLFLCCIGTMFMSCIETGVKKYASDCYPPGLHSMLLFLICDLDV